MELGSSLMMWAVQGKRKQTENVVVGWRGPWPWIDKRRNRAEQSRAEEPIRTPSN